MATVTSLPLTGDAEADALLATDPLALLIGMLLDQQIPMEWAFHSPALLRQRLGGRLDCAEIAGYDPEALIAIFTGPPALHRFPKAMAARTQALCQDLIDRFDAQAEQVWAGAVDGAALLANVKALPGFGEQKARIFIALLAKRLGVRPPEWEKAAGAYGAPGYFSVADIDSPDALARVREYKKEAKARAKAATGAPAAKSDASRPTKARATKASAAST
ncbi:MAG: HhH-GPD-type base excision DNA repair protein [Acidimicrobiales bacterium]